FINWGLAVGGAALLVSGIFGLMLRRAVSATKGDAGGRVLSVLADERLVVWRGWHIPALATLASLATVRWMALAFFAAS
ncbi:MAG: hypothetical protein AAF449_18780, partial [Myxococcota bacterium]